MWTNERSAAHIFNTYSCWIAYCNELYIFGCCTQSTNCLRDAHSVPGQFHLWKTISQEFRQTHKHSHSIRVISFTKVTRNTQTRTMLVPLLSERKKQKRRMNARDGDRRERTRHTQKISTWNDNRNLFPLCFDSMNANKRRKSHGKKLCCGENWNEKNDVRRRRRQPWLIRSCSRFDQ